MNKAIDGFILGVKDYREYDAILQVLTKQDGIQSFVAKGIRKISSKNAAVCQRFLYARFYVDYKEGQTIHGMRTADKLESFRTIQEDLTKQSIASVLCDMILSFYNDKEFILLDDLLLTFQRLNKTQKPYIPASLFLVRLLELQGIKPIVDQCALCGSTQHICSFSAMDGGFVCTSCNQDGIKKETKEDLKMYRILVLCDFQQDDIIERCCDVQFAHFDALYKFYETYSGIALKSMKFLRTIENMNRRNSV